MITVVIDLGLLVRGGNWSAAADRGGLVPGWSRGLCTRSWCQCSCHRGPPGWTGTRGDAQRSYCFGSWCPSACCGECHWHECDHRDGGIGHLRAHLSSGDRQACATTSVDRDPGICSPHCVALPGNRHPACRGPPVGGVCRLHAFPLSDRPGGDQTYPCS